MIPQMRVIHYAHPAAPTSGLQRPGGGVAGWKGPVPFRPGRQYGAFWHVHPSVPGWAYRVIAFAVRVWVCFRVLRAADSANA